jgi:hypothetical protein
MTWRIPDAKANVASAAMLTVAENEIFILDIGEREDVFAKMGW